LAHAENAGDGGARGSQGRAATRDSRAHPLPLAARGLRRRALDMGATGYLVEADCRSRSRAAKSSDCRRERPAVRPDAGARTEHSARHHHQLRETAARGDRRGGPRTAATSPRSTAPRAGCSNCSRASRRSTRSATTRAIRTPNCAHGHAGGRVGGAPKRGHRSLARVAPNFFLSIPLAYSARRERGTSSQRSLRPEPVLCLV